MEHLLKFPFFHIFLFVRLFIEGSLLLPFYVQIINIKQMSLEVWIHIQAFNCCCKSSSSTMLPLAVNVCLGFLLYHVICNCFTYFRCNLLWLACSLCILVPVFAAVFPIHRINQEWYGIVDLLDQNSGSDSLSLNQLFQISYTDQKI